MQDEDRRFCSLPSLTLTPSQCPWRSSARKLIMTPNCGSLMSRSDSRMQKVGRPLRRQQREMNLSSARMFSVSSAMSCER